MKQSSTADERQESSTESSQRTEQKNVGRRTGIRNFIHWDREDQLEAFFAWLPKELHHMPGVNWATLPPEIMGYCVRDIGSSPDSVLLAVAAGSMCGAASLSVQQSLMRDLKGLLRDLRSGGYIQCIADLKQEQIWHEWAANQKKIARGRDLLNGYVSLSTGYIPRYLLRLDPADRLCMQQYTLPPLPPDIRERYFPAKRLRAAQQASRKATTDILVPLYPVLRQLIRFRKQLAERTVLAIREARRKVEAGEAALPYHFQHIDTIPEMNRDARTIADVHIFGREVKLNLTLWDKRSWVEYHHERYSDESVKNAREGKYAYTPEKNRFFVQFDSPPSECLWFGDLMQQHLFQHMTKDSGLVEGFQERWKYARLHGFSHGCASRPGLLSSGDPWFADATGRGDELIIEYESWYRGILYGATLAMLALSNGSRMSELLQVSWNKERRIVRTEALVVLGKDGQPLMGDDGKPITKIVKLHFQHLLPKGAKTEEERQLFPLSKEAMRLIGEVKELLEQTYGEIPLVAPAHTNVKHEHLKPERYLFQWAPSPDGKVGSYATLLMPVVV